MILVLDKEGRRLCLDDRWRDFANFGDRPSSVKVYRSLGYARRRADRIGGRVAVIPPGMYVEAGGDVIESRKAGPNLIVTVRQPLSQFVVG